MGQDFLFNNNYVEFRHPLRNRMKLHKTLQSHKLLTTLGFLKAVWAQTPLLVPGSAVIVVVVVCAKRGGCLSTWNSGRTSYVQPSSSRPTGRPRGHCFFFLFWQGPWKGGYGFDNPVTVFVLLFFWVCVLFQHWFQEMLVPSKHISYFTRF